MLPLRVNDMVVVRNCDPSHNGLKGIVTDVQGGYLARVSPHPTSPIRVPERYFPRNQLRLLSFKTYPKAGDRVRYVGSEEQFIGDSGTVMEVVSAKGGSRRGPYIVMMDKYPLRAVDFRRDELRILRPKVKP
jgi:hypothetical protein